MNATGSSETLPIRLDLSSSPLPAQPLPLLLREERRSQRASRSAPWLSSISTVSLISFLPLAVFSSSLSLQISSAMLICLRWNRNGVFHQPPPFRPSPNSSTSPRLSETPPNPPPSISPSPRSTSIPKLPSPYPPPPPPPRPPPLLLKRETLLLPKGWERAGRARKQKSSRLPLLRRKEMSNRREDEGWSGSSS
jgi:hypothetical protein